MTTIAFRDGTLASDSMMIRSGWKVGHKAVKVWRTSDGRLIGICGEFAHAMRLVEWLRVPPTRRRSPRPELDKDGGTVVEVLGPRNAKFYEWNGVHQVREAYWSVGSGMIAALVAMDFGASATIAVRAAIRRDDSSGGSIRSVKL